jgi:HK97 family phage portal protein
VNKLQQAVGWMLKAIGFPPWNLSSNPSQPYSSFFRGTSGAEALERLSTVYICCNLLGRRVSTFPLGVYESDGEISVPADSYINDLLKQPNEYMNKVVFLETMLLNFNLSGNAYAQIITLDGRRVTALWPLPYQRVKPVFTNGVLTYEVALPDRSTPVTLRSSDVLHVRNFSFDGINGLSPLRLHAIRRGMAAAEFSENFLNNRGLPSLVFSSPDKPSPEARDELRKTGDRLYSGPENAGRIIWAFGGMKVEGISLSPADAQLIETMRMSDADIAAAYGVPLNLLNQTDKSATYASAEQFNRYFVDYGLDPLCVRFATAFGESLLNSRLKQSIKFNLDALLAGDSTARINYLRTAVASSLMTPNEGRAKLNLPPLPGGDELITQSNMAPLSLLEEINSTPEPAPVPAIAPPPAKPMLAAPPKQRYLPAWR